jgi:hypothetical protein
MASAVGIGTGQRVTQFHARSSTPAERLTPQAMNVPDDPIKLQDHFLACRTCGVAVRVEDEDDVITVEISAESAPVSPQNPL